MTIQVIPYTDISFDVVNDSTETLITVARRVKELKRAIEKTESALDPALLERAQWIENARVELVTK